MASPNRRGEYRAIYETMVDHPRFQVLAPPARLLLYVLKTRLGPLGLAVLYREQLIGWTGLPGEVVERAAQELEQHGWIRREWRVWWLIDGLENEPNLSLANANHSSFLARQAHALPYLEIVRDFLQHYGLEDEREGDDPTPAPTLPDGMGDGMGYPIGDGIDHPIPDHKTTTKTTTTPYTTPPNTRVREDCGNVENSATDRGGERTAEGEQRDKKLARLHITDAQLRKIALDELALGKRKKAHEQAQVHREVAELLHDMNRDNLHDALRGLCLIRDEGKCGFNKDTPYTPGVLIRWPRVWYGEGDSRNKIALVEAAQRRWREELEDGAGRSRPTGLTRAGVDLDALSA